MVSDKIEDIGPIAERPVGQSNTSNVLIIFLTHTCLLSIIKKYHKIRYIRVAEKGNEGDS